MIARPIFDSQFQRVIVPVSDREDARSTAAAVTPYLDSDIGELVAVHVIEKAGGAPDKASVEQRETYANDIFAIMAESLPNATPLETKILYGTSIAEAIIYGAEEVNATAIVFTPRGGSKWVKLLTEDVTTGLVHHSDIPILVLPDVQEEKATP